MSKVTKREWYRRVNASWPATVPGLTAAEATKAAKRLYRYAMGRTFQGPVRVTRGRRYTWVRRGEMVVNPEQGWQGLVHLLSHYCASRVLPDEAGHGSAHARMEMRMIKQVVRRGWLDGRLAAPVPVPVVRDRRAERIEGLHTRLARWEAKQRRAVNAIRKITRQLRANERAIERDTPT